MHAELLTLIVINVDSSLPLADVTTQLLQPITQFRFLFANLSSRQATSRCHLLHMDQGRDWAWDVASLGVGMEHARRISGSIGFLFWGWHCIKPRRTANV